MFSVVVDNRSFHLDIFEFRRMMVEAFLDSLIDLKQRPDKWLSHVSSDHSWQHQMVGQEYLKILEIIICVKVIFSTYKIYVISCLMI